MAVNARSRVRAVLNLEACGHSGKAILFQAGASAMVRMMFNVPYPHGTVAVRGAARAPTAMIQSISDVGGHLRV